MAQHRRSPKSHKVKILSWNAAVVHQVGGNKNARNPEFLKLVDDEKPDILCIQESHITPSGGRKREKNEFKVEGYQVLRFDVPGKHCENNVNDKANKSKAGNESDGNKGVCMLVKDGIAMSHERSE